MMKKPTMSRRGRGVLFILLLIIGSVVVFYWMSRKPIQHEMSVAYPVSDSIFKNTMEGVIGRPFVEGNRMLTFVNGDEIFPAMLEGIASAKQSVTFETYIWSPGKVCEEFKEALCAKAKEGVKVYVVVDGAGSFKMPSNHFDELNAAGVKIKKFNRGKWYSVNVQFNHRDHRKLLIIDGRICFIGGASLHDSWLGNAETEKQWRDNHFRIEGPSVREFQGIFSDNWRQTTGEILHGSELFPALKPMGDLKIQAQMSGPKDGQETIKVAFIYAMASAKKNIRIAHAYFMPDEIAMKTLLTARKRGVEIEVVVPGKIDSKVVKAASRANWLKLMEAGAHFYEYGPAMYHVKEMIIDDHLVIGGSANFDNRSFRINDEANFNVLDAAFASERIKAFEKDKNSGRPLSVAELENRPLSIKMGEKLATIFGSQF